MWFLLPQSTTESCSAASLETLSHLKLEAKLPSLGPGSFLYASLYQAAFLLTEKTASLLSCVTLKFNVAFHAAAIAC